MTLLLFYFIYASDWLRFLQKCVDILSSGLKIPRSHLTWKFGNKCLNVREWAEVVERYKDDSSLPCCPVNRQYVLIKTQIKNSVLKYMLIESYDVSVIILVQWGQLSCCFSDAFLSAFKILKCFVLLYNVMATYRVLNRPEGWLIALFSQLALISPIMSTLLREINILFRETSYPP